MKQRTGAGTGESIKRNAEPGPGAPGPAGAEAPLLRNYVDGHWVDSGGGASLPVMNPSLGRALARVPLSPKSAADQAVEAAHAAFASWRKTPAAQRVSYLYRLLELLRANRNEITRRMVEESGKSIPDAAAEIKRMMENIEVACSAPLLQQGANLVGAAADVDGEVLRLPKGVFAVIAPFNFPVMVAFWFVPYAIATGNTCVVKPSELTPCTMQLVAQCVHETGLPAGVFNLVNGDRVVAEAWLDHPRVQGVSFVGSTRVCRLVAERCARSNKRCQALGSAKNHLVVMPDARLEEVIRNLLTSCYGCAGQRCMAASVIVCVGDDTYRTVGDRFLQASRDVLLANPLDPRVADEPLVMGPVISAAARDRILGLIEAGLREGATLALDGRGLAVAGCEQGYFIGPTVFTGVRPGMKIHQTEIFGPVASIMKVDSLDQALAIINAHEYANGASIYTQNGYYARKFKLEAEVGMIGVNVGIPAPVASLPFGGTRCSLFADIKAQGKNFVDFFTDQKVITQRFWTEP